MSPSGRPRLVLIAGPSGSGKSRLAHAAKVPSLRLDDYYFDADHPELPKTDYGIGGTQVEALDDANAPFAQMFMMEGRTEEQKAAVIDLVSQAFVDALSAALEKTRVWITEVPKTNWGIGGKTAKSIGR